MSSVVQKHGVRRLGEVCPETNLVPLSAGQDPESSLLAREFHDSLLEDLDGGVTLSVIDIIAKRGIEDGLEYVSIL